MSIEERMENVGECCGFNELPDLNNLNPKEGLLWKCKMVIKKFETYVLSSNTAIYFN